METRALLFCLGTREKTEREKDSRRLDLDCRTAPTRDGHHGRIRTRIGAFKYFTESLRSLFSYGSGLMAISFLRRPQSSICCRDVFCLRCCVTLFWPDGPCIKSGPIRTRPRVRARHQAPLVILLGINKD